MGQYETFQKDVSNGDYSFDAKHDGKYLYCFGNEHWGAHTKEVSFNVHGIVYVSEHEAEKDPLETESTWPPHFLLPPDAMLALLVPPADILRLPLPPPIAVRKLSDLLNQVKDEQSYIVLRERTHRNTAESTNSRVKWWNLFVIGMVIGESVFQVWWLRRFFEVKRVV